MYYKVMTAELRSAWMEDKASIQYVVGETVYPKAGKLFVFDDLVEATKFANVPNKMRYKDKRLLYECEVTNPGPPPEFIPWCAWTEFELFWNILEMGRYTWTSRPPEYSDGRREAILTSGDPRDFSCILPLAHTVCVDSVKLTKRVDYVEVGYCTTKS